MIFEIVFNKYIYYLYKPNPLMIYNKLTQI